MYEKITEQLLNLRQNSTILKQAVNEQFSHLDHKERSNNIIGKAFSLV